MDDQRHIEGAAPPVNRFLMAAVYGMAVLLVLMFLGVIGGIIYKFKQRSATPPNSGLVSLGLPPESAIREALLTGDKLTLNTGAEVFIIEVSTGRVLLRVKAAAQ
jgi:hypothetical protein